MRAPAAEIWLVARAPVRLAAVETAAEALEEARANSERHFHLILLDMILPDRSGCEILPQLRAAVGDDVAIVMASSDSHVRPPRPQAQSRDALAHAPPVQFSRGLAQISLVQLCVRRGADAFLVKPLASEEVQHIWQFVKNHEQGSFHRRIDTDDPEAGSSIVSSSSAEPTPVLASAGSPGATAPDSSIIVCGGCVDSAGAAEAATSDIRRSGSIGGDMSARGGNSEHAGQACCAHSAWSTADPADSLLEDKEPEDPELRPDEPVGADCKQQ